MKGKIKERRRHGETRCFFHDEMDIVLDAASSWNTAGANKHLELRGVRV